MSRARQMADLERRKATGQRYRYGSPEKSLHIVLLVKSVHEAHHISNSPGLLTLTSTEEAHPDQTTTEMPQIHEIPHWLADSHPTGLLSVRDGQDSSSRGTARKADGDNSKWFAAQASAATGDMTLAETELALQYARLKYLQAEAADPDGQASFNNLFYLDAVKTELAIRYTAELAVSYRLDQLHEADYPL